MTSEISYPLLVVKRLKLKEVTKDGLKQDLLALSFHSSDPHFACPRIHCKEHIEKSRNNKDAIL